MFGHVFQPHGTERCWWVDPHDQEISDHPASKSLPGSHRAVFFACDNGLSNHLGSLLKVSKFDIKETSNKGFMDGFLACCDYTFTADQWSIIQVRLGRMDCRLLRLESNKVGPNWNLKEKHELRKNAWFWDEESMMDLNYHEMTMPCILYQINLGSTHFFADRVFE